MPLSIERMLQNLQISAPTSLRSSAKSPQINIQCPPRQDVRQHYGYRVNPNFMLSLESKLRSEPGFDNSAFHNPMSLARKWISNQLHYYEFDYKYCHDPEQRPPVKLLYKEWEYPEGASDDEEEEDEEEEEKLFIITVLSVCSDDPASFHARPTQAQMDLLTNFLGSQPQWWTGYRGFC